MGPDGNARRTLARPAAAVLAKDGETCCEIVFAANSADNMLIES
jgi:hypothetical protein